MTSTRGQPDPRPIIAAEDLRRLARPISQELSVAEWFADQHYQTGLIRFTPGAGGQPNAIVHHDRDVLCFVLAGRGQLRLGQQANAIRAGMLCRVPAGTPHDFSAEDEPLELLYTTVKVDPRSAAEM
jgi:mannose-6-phosphate isomerase-like protein (cupin superfamily)